MEFPQERRQLGQSSSGNRVGVPKPVFLDDKGYIEIEAVNNMMIELNNRKVYNITDEIKARSPYLLAEIMLRCEGSSSYELVPDAATTLNIDLTSGKFTTKQASKSVFQTLVKANEVANEIPDPTSVFGTKNYQGMERQLLKVVNQKRKLNKKAPIPKLPRLRSWKNMYKLLEQYDVSNLDFQTIPHARFGFYSIKVDERNNVVDAFGHEIPEDLKKLVFLRHGPQQTYSICRAHLKPTTSLPDDQSDDNLSQLLAEMDEDQQTVQASYEDRLVNLALSFAENKDPPMYSSIKFNLEHWFNEQKDSFLHHGLCAVLLGVSVPFVARFDPNTFTPKQNEESHTIQWTIAHNIACAARRSFKSCIFVALGANDFGKIFVPTTGSYKVVHVDKDLKVIPATSSNEGFELVNEKGRKRSKPLLSSPETMQMELQQRSNDIDRYKEYNIRLGPNELYHAVIIY